MDNFMTSKLLHPTLLSEEIAAEVEGNIFKRSLLQLARCSFGQFFHVIHDSGPPFQVCRPDGF